MVQAFCRAVDKTNEWVGRGVSLVFIPLVLLVMTEVVLRYFFNSPTIWSWDVNIQLSAALIALGGGYALLYKGHVLVDIFVSRFSPRVRAIIDMVTALIFFIGIGVLLWLAVGEAKISVATGERFTSLLEPVLGPIRIAIAVGIFLILLQGIAKFIRDLQTATGATREDIS